MGKSYVGTSGVTPERKEVRSIFFCLLKEILRFFENFEDVYMNIRFRVYLNNMFIFKF